MFVIAVTDAESNLSAITQLVSLVGALFVCRFATKSRSTIGLVAFLGGFAAMLANIFVDGQGACLLIGYSPIIYLLAVAGRSDLRWDW